LARQIAMISYKSAPLFNERYGAILTAAAKIPMWPRARAAVSLGPV